MAVQEKPVQQRKRMSLRVDQQTHVKRTLVDTASEGEVYEDYNFGATLGTSSLFCVTRQLLTYMPSCCACLRPVCRHLIQAPNCLFG